MLASPAAVSLDGLFNLFSAAPSWLSAVSGIIAAASAVTALTLTPSDDQIVGKIYRVIELLALNVGHAKDLPPNQRQP